MPSAQKHADQSTRNTELSDLLQQEHNEYSEWVVTTAFYAAVHAIDAFLAREAQHHPEGHQQRVKALTRSRPKAAATYLTLRNVSEQARYRCARFSDEEVSKYKADATTVLAKQLTTL